jgi:hypothetical protein
VKKKSSGVFCRVVEEDGEEEEGKRRLGWWDSPKGGPEKEPDNVTAVALVSRREPRMEVGDMEPYFGSVCRGLGI